MASNGTSALSADKVEKTAQDFSSPNAKPNAWSDPGPAAFDFRSDTITTPTTSMLNAIASTTLLDDVFLEDPCTMSLESSVAALTGHPAALLVLSGTMGNQLALRTHLLAPPHAVLCDHRSHIFTYEAGGVASLSGAQLQTVIPANGHHITLADVQAHAVISDNVHACPTRVVSLENTLNGTIMPLAEARRIAAWARAQSPPVIMHLDGARLWEAVAAGAGSLKDYALCFDSMSLCFSKGLGAPIGSVIVGSQAFVKRARWVRKSIGGGMRQTGVVAAPMRVALEDTFLAGRLAHSHANARTVAAIWHGLGGSLAYPVETNMVWLDLEAAGLTADQIIKIGVDEGLKLRGGRLVVHYQIGEEAIQRLTRVMERALKAPAETKTNGHVDQTTAEKLKVDVE